MKKTLLTILTCLCSVFVLPAQLHYRFADREEGLRHLEADSAYFLSLSKNNIAWRARNSEVSLAELKLLARNQIVDFTSEEARELAIIVDSIASILQQVGVALSLPDEITFIKSRMGTEFGAGGYTRGTDIYLSSDFVSAVMARKGSERRDAQMIHLVAHEIFHCLTRNNPPFRQSMYSLIGFTVMDHEIDFPLELRNLLLTNPDVDRMDNFALFTIEGKERPCALVTICPKTWEEIEKENPNANLFQYVSAALMPLDSLNTWFPTSAASDFRDKVGHNTDYVIAPEECLADNFGYLVLAKGMNLKNDSFKSPQLLQDILATLQQYYPATKPE